MFGVVVKLMMVETRCGPMIFSSASSIVAVLMSASVVFFEAIGEGGWMEEDGDYEKRKKKRLHWLLQTY